MKQETQKPLYKPIRSTVVETKEDWIKLWEDSSNRGTIKESRRMG